MFSYLGRRASYSVISILGLLTLVFFLTRLTGDPSALYLPLDSTPEARAAFAHLNGLDQPTYIQFWHFLTDLLRLDFGESMRQHRSAMGVALEAFPQTLKLAAVAILLSTTLAIIIGSVAAAKPRGIFDRLASLVSLAGASAPDFWVAIVAILVFAVGLDILPTSGTGGWQYWIMPVFVLMLRPFGLLVQVVRGAMLSSLASPYIKTARAKGLSRQSIVFGHALRNCLLPVITVAGDLATGLINGAVIVESVFGWPGIGKLMIDSIIQRDFAVVQSTILVTAIAIFILNIVIDLLYAVLDPRVRY
ncbi:MAG: ABC transporter permease [Advenella sp.]|jgi:peptide/nickel transport system permease protein|uniref:Peptide/nickel transport system permease protein n=1 Tax=Advenella incenata TaxID=267800 RepID=A0A4Q7VUK8_9BURK|nr:ABC transporter permease [Advenella incenata]RZU00321.1 peptide/nickel transport system permease protein [Advenella incenata]